jgi:hypothetical protein
MTDEKIIGNKALKVEVLFDAVEKGRIFPKNMIQRFCSMGEFLVVGRSDGQLFWNKNGFWEEINLNIKGLINIIKKDGDDILVGGGSCCSGGAFCLTQEGNVLPLRPIKGQGDDDSGRPEFLQGNVYAFARRGEDLLVGVRGCAGQHIYILNKDKQLEFYYRSFDFNKDIGFLGYKIENFFTFRNKLYAYGLDSDGMIGKNHLFVLLEDDWSYIACFDDVLEFVVHNDVVYAGGGKIVNGRRRAVIYRVMI